MIKPPKPYLCVLLLLLSGCATGPLERARGQFYRGGFPSTAPAGTRKTDSLLHLLEWGLIHHTAADYETSNAELLKAAETAERL